PDQYFDGLIEEAKDRIKDYRMVIKKPTENVNIKNYENQILELESKIKEFELIKGKPDKEKREGILGIYLKQVRDTLQTPLYDSVKEDFSKYIDALESVGRLACEDYISVETANMIDNLGENFINIANWRDFFNIETFDHLLLVNELAKNTLPEDKNSLY